MIFRSKQIKGKGKGTVLGFPTINLEIPEDLVFDDGIYAAWVAIDYKTYKGALHYGPTPTFHEVNKSMEVYLLDVTHETAPVTKNVLIEVDIVERLRDVQTFADPDDLVAQIAEDVQKVNTILK